MLALKISTHVSSYIAARFCWARTPMSKSLLLQHSLCSHDHFDRLR